VRDERPRRIVDENQLGVELEKGLEPVVDRDLPAGAPDHRRQQLAGDTLSRRLITQHVVRMDDRQNMVNAAVPGKRLERPRQHWNAAKVGVLLGAARGAGPAATAGGNDNGYG